MNRESQKTDFSGQLNSAKSGHLVFLSEITGFTILADPSMSERARGSFKDVLSRVRVDKDEITIQFRDSSSLDVMHHSQEYLGAITLNPSIPTGDRVSRTHRKSPSGLAGA